MGSNFPATKRLHLRVMRSAPDAPFSGLVVGLVPIIAHRRLNL
jgi:hypothetical protein